MLLNEILKVSEGILLTNTTNLEVQAKGAFAADLMSDVLASIQPEAILLTGLCNPQVVRTALIADVKAIIFVRAKNPAPETIELANSEDVPLISSPLGLYELSGRLHKAGLLSLEKRVDLPYDEN
ncbi:MAG: DRTGG domain-containing protein [Anaerolineaceae bacterium]|nr:DRTGG domain-containing protein [Anaerolineaceae bacterium]